MARKLRNVKLDEISFVGKGDNPEAHVLLLKIKKEDGIVALGKEYKGEEQDVALNKWMDENPSMLTKDDGDALTFADIATDRELKDKIWTMCYMLEDSLGSIVRDDTVTDKSAMIQTSIEQFKTAITALTKGEETMTPEQIEALKKEKEAAEAKVVELTKQNEELVAKANTCPSCGAAMEDGVCKACGGKKKVAKEEDEVIKGLPESIQKELIANREAIAKMQDNELTREFIAKAAEVTLVGKADEIGDILKSVAKYDTALADKIMTVFKASHARIAEGDLLKEAGKTTDPATGSSAYDKIVAKAAELRKTSPELTEAQAFTKVYDSDADLRKEYLEERNAQ